MFATAGRTHPPVAGGDVPVYFEKNLGQVDASVLYTFRAAGRAVALVGHGAHFSISHKQITLSLTGASRLAAVTPEEPVEGHSNYYFSSDPRRWVENVPQFRRVRYHDIYPGVDLVWYGTGQQLEYDLELQAGVDPSQIRLQFSGADSVSVADNGDVVVKAGGEELRQRKPAVWQQRGSERAQIDAGYVQLATGELGVRVAEYDHSLLLTIDPVLSYSTFLGGSIDTNPSAIALDPGGGVFVSGSTYSDDFPGTSGSGGLFVAKLNPAGSGVVYVTYFGQPGDIANAVATDGHGSAFVTGTANSMSFPVTPGTVQPVRGSSGGFLLKLGPTGHVVWGTYLGGIISNAVAADAAGNTYLAGVATGSGLQVNAPSCLHRLDVFVGALNPSASAWLNATCFGGNSQNNATAIALDPQLNVYVTGTTFATDLPTTPGAFQRSWKGTAGQGTGFVAKLKSGSLSYLTYLGGSYWDSFNAIAVDASGNAYLGGFTRSPDYPVTPGAFEPRYSSSDLIGVVTKLDPKGASLVWSTFLGGAAANVVQGIAVDPSGNVYVAGETTSLNFPTTTGAISSYPRSQYSSDDDIFVTQLSPDGSALIYSGTLGSTGVDRAVGLARSDTGDLYITGWSESSIPQVSDNYPTTAGAYQTTLPSLSGGSSGVVTKIDMTSPADCTPSLSADGDVISGIGGAGSVEVTVPAGCPWEAVADRGITLGEPTHGTTSALLPFSVSENGPGILGRTLHIAVGPKTYTITQQALYCRVGTELLFCSQPPRIRAPGPPTPPIPPVGPRRR